MKKCIVIISGVILMLSFIIIGVNIAKNNNAEKDGVCAFFGENAEWLATYTSIKIKGVNYDSFYIKYVGYDDKKDYIDKFNYELRGTNFFIGGPVEFKNSHDTHLILKEENKGDGIMDARKCLELDLSIKSPRGWQELTLKRVNTNYSTTKPYDATGENE